MKKTALATILILLIFSGFSQTEKKSTLLDNWNFGINYGLNLFHGDLRVYQYFPVKNPVSERKSAYSFYFTKEFSPIFSLGGQMLFGKLAGVSRDTIYNIDPLLNVRKLYFNTNVFENTIWAKVNFTNLFFGKNENRLISWYGIAGVGFSNFRIKKMELYTNRIIESRGYAGDEKIKSTSEGVIPIGTGLNIRLNERLKLDLAFTIRGLNTDLLDLTTYDENPRDMYSYTYIGLNYKFNWRVKLNKKSQEIEPQIALADTVKEIYKAKCKLPLRGTIGDTINSIVSISKGSLSNEASFEQIFPDNFIIKPFEINEAVVSIEKNKLNISWDSLPERILIKVSYDILTDSVKEGNYNIDGLFRFTNKLGEQDSIKVDNSILMVLPDTITEMVVENQTDISTADKETIQILEEKVKSLEFRVQIGASYNKKADTTWLRNKYKFTEPIFEDQQKNWYKYTLGSFEKYKDAVDLKRELVKNGAEMPFIVAFKDNKRMNSLNEITNDNFVSINNTFYTENGYYFRIQVAASYQKPLPIYKLEYELKLEGESISEEKHTNWYKYTVGHTRSYEEAKSLRDKLRATNVPDAFIVTYFNGSRASLNDALLQKKNK